MEIILLTLTVTFVVFVIIYLQWIPLFFRRLKYIFYSPDYYEARLVREILSRKSVFFKSLSEEGKNRMIKKSIKFMMSKRFIAMEGMALTDEMIAEISGTAAQITFGLKNSEFSHFHTIKIYPETFYSRMADGHLKGGASVGGVLLFSWEDFQLGYSDYSDRYNLGLHEMAHALRLQMRYGSDFDTWFGEYSDEWMKIAAPEFQKMQHQDESFLRKYASTNMEEFFSVCIEHFFEVPNEFKASLPEIYNNLCYLLRVDPTNKNGDFKLDENLIKKMQAEHEVRKRNPGYSRTPREVSWHWSFNLIIGGFFIALPIVLIYLPTLLLSHSIVFTWFLIILALIFKFRERFRNWGIILFRHFILFAITGVALPLIAVLLMMNTTASVNPVTTSYPISGYYIKLKGGEEYEITYKLKDDVFNEFGAVRRLSDTGPPDYLAKAHTLILTTSTGAIGIDKVDKRHLLIENDTIVIPFPDY